MRVVRCKKPGSYAARNALSKAAKGDWLVFTDADCLPEPGWVDHLLEGQKIDELRAGRVKMEVMEGRRTLFACYDQVKGIPQEHYVARGYAATANLSVPRKVYERLGGFDERRYSGGDADFCRRAVAAGFQLSYRPEAVVRHAARTRWYELARKVRRLRGGQIVGHRGAMRSYRVLRSFLPPATHWFRYLRETRHPWRDRWVACAVEAALWPIGVWESLRLLAGKPPERR